MKKIENLFLYCKKENENLDGLINNAGIRQRKNFEDISQSDLDHIYEINLKSIFFLTQIFRKLLKRIRAQL